MCFLYSQTVHKRLHIDVGCAPGQHVAAVGANSIQSMTYHHWWSTSHEGQSKPTGRHSECRADLKKKQRTKIKEIDPIQIHFCVDNKMCQYKFPCRQELWDTHKFNLFNNCTNVNMTWMFECLIDILTHWGRDKMAAIFQTTFSKAFSWMKMFKFRLNFHWSLFPKVQLTILQHWFR